MSAFSVTLVVQFARIPKRVMAHCSSNATFELQEREIKTAVDCPVSVSAVELIAVSATDSQRIPVTEKFFNLSDIARSSGYILRKVIGSEEHDVNHCVVAQRIVNGVTIRPDPKVYSTFRDELPETFIFNHIGIQYDTVGQITRRQRCLVLTQELGAGYRP